MPRCHQCACDAIEAPVLLFDQNPNGDGVPSPRTLDDLAFALLENLFSPPSDHNQQWLDASRDKKVPDARAQLPARS